MTVALEWLGRTATLVCATRRRRNTETLATCYHGGDGAPRAAVCEPGAGCELGVGPGVVLAQCGARHLPVTLPPAHVAGRGLHSSTFQLNLSALCGMLGARRGCVARDKGGLGGVYGVWGVLLCQARFKFSGNGNECIKPLVAGRVRARRHLLHRPRLPHPQAAGQERVRVPPAHRRHRPRHAAEVVRRLGTGGGSHDRGPGAAAGGHPRQGLTLVHFSAQLEP